MKALSRLIILAGLLAALALPAQVFAQGGEPQDEIVLGDNYTLVAGESVKNLTILGGNVVLEVGSNVVDHIFLFGGTLTVNGTVGEDIHIYGGQLYLSDTAIVGGDISLTGGDVQQADGATINGNVTRSNVAPFGLPIPETPVIRLPYYVNGLDPLLNQIFWFLMQTVGLTALAMLVILFAPQLTERAGDAALARPWAAGGVGLLVAVLTPPLLIGMTVTLIGIPVTLVMILVVSVILTFGWIALGLEVGKRLAQAFHQNWPVVMSAGLGTLLLSVVANGIGLTPCVGWIVPALVGFVGMGGVLLSRFGTQVYPASVPTAPAPVA